MKFPSHLRTSAWIYRLALFLVACVFIGSNVLYGQSKSSKKKIYVDYDLVKTSKGKGKYYVVLEEQTSGIWTASYYEVDRKKRVYKIDFKTAEMLVKHGKEIRYNAYEQTITEYSEYKDGLLDGNYVDFNAVGDTVQSGSYKRGKKDGFWRSFNHSDHKLKLLIEYKEGHYSGLYKKFKKGVLEKEGVYNYRKRNGLWTFYFPSGKKYQERTYVNDQTVGPATEWYRNGNKKSSGNYAIGFVKKGEWKYYDWDGNLKGPNTEKKEGNETDNLEYTPGQVVEISAEPIGGMSTFNRNLGRYLSKNYPELARQDGVGGKVYVSFIVGKDGELMDFSIRKGARSDLDEVAIEAIKSLGKWKPAMYSGIPVKQAFTIPIAFRSM